MIDAYPDNNETEEQQEEIPLDISPQENMEDKSTTMSSAVGVYPANERKYTLLHRQIRINLAANKEAEDEDPPEAKSSIEISDSNESPSYTLTKQQLAAIANSDLGPIKDRLLLATTSFAPRIASGKNGSLDIQDDFRHLFLQWFGGTAYYPFRRSHKDNWPEIIDMTLPVKIVGSRSPIFAPDTLTTIERIKRAGAHASEILSKTNGPIEFMEGVARSANDIATEFGITPSRKYSAWVRSMYSLMFRDAIMEFTNFEEAKKYKADHPYRQVSALYSNKLGLAPLEALAQYYKNDIQPYIDLSSIRNGITGAIRSFRGRPTAADNITWAETFATVAKDCSHIIVKGDRREYKGTKRELVRTLNGQETEPAKMLEHLVDKTLFKGPYVLDIDPLLTQYRGKKALTLDRNIPLHFAYYMASLHGVKLPKPE